MKISISMSGSWLDDPKMRSLAEEGHKKGEDIQYIEAGIVKAFRDLFPHGYVNVYFIEKGISRGSIHVSVGLIGEQRDLSSNIRENDPMLHKWLIQPDSNGWVAEMVQGSLFVRPTQPHLAMSRVKTGWRKSRGDSRKIVATYERFFKKLKKLVADNKDDIYQVEKYDARYFK